MSLTLALVVAGYATLGALTELGIRAIERVEPIPPDQRLSAPYVVILWPALWFIGIVTLIGFALVIGADLVRGRHR